MECLKGPLQDHGITPVESLTSCACLAVACHAPTRKTWEELWASGTGRTWKALKDFPDRLRPMAKEVEQVNESPFFAPFMFVNAKARHAELVRKRLSVLPGIMRVYAAGLEAHIAGVPDLTAKNYLSPRRTVPIALATFLRGQSHNGEVDGQGSR
jgi:hypothetical protein